MDAIISFPRSTNSLEMSFSLEQAEARKYFEVHMTEQQSGDPANTQIVQQTSSNDRLLVSGVFSGFSPALLFTYWIQPERICQWWPQEAEIVPQPGGIYRLSWPHMGWVMNGKVIESVPGERLVFSWRWDHTPEVPERTVHVTLSPRSDGGTDLTVEHSRYTETAADQEERAGHLEGWLHFLGQLQALRP